MNDWRNEKLDQIEAELAQLFPKVVAFAREGDQCGCLYLKCCWRENGGGAYAGIPHDAAPDKISVEHTVAYLTEALWHAAPCARA